MESENRRVTRWSSVMNSEYPGYERWLVCECGYEEEVLGRDKEERFMALEHSVRMLGVEIQKLDLRTVSDEPE